MERATWRTLMSELPIKRISGQVDWRAELGVVMGETARGVPAGTRGKSIDTFGPVGPAVPSSRLPDPQSRWLARRVDGMAVKDGVTADMVFGVDEIIGFTSEAITLEPSHLIATETPVGVDGHQSPPRWLGAGEKVVVEVEVVGSVSNPVFGYDPADAA
jgi:2-keto-4-pentenoate hydratase/2-oxohepta-3-ene-1,7-dioic acid hydratase in catechol pathway